MVMSSCFKSAQDVPHKKFTIEVTYLDGYKEIKVWTLPIESKFEIYPDRGTYSLDYSSDQCQPCTGRLLSGVIRYKLISVK